MTSWANNHEVDAQIYPAGASKWRWRLLHRNGRVLAYSGVGYASVKTARRSIRLAGKFLQGGLNIRVLKEGV